ncbi:MAG: hypothetical protein NT007_19135 [Candidatus Kapabacteria bacterium]|nr:hypothetical protein [Candidatus Kapabacteria bacterium]
MKKTIIIILLLGSSFNLSANNQKLSDEFTSQFGLFYRHQSASKLFDNSGNNVTDYPLPKRATDTSNYRNLYDNTSNQIGFSIRYSFLKNFVVYSDFGIKFNQLEEKLSGAYHSPDGLYQGSYTTLNSKIFYRTTSELLIGLRYRLYEADIFSYFSADVKFPNNFSAGPAAAADTNGFPVDTSDNKFLAGKTPFEFSPNLTIGYKFEKSRISLNSTYLIRSDNWANAIKIRANIGFETVPDTYLQFFLQYYRTISDSVDKAKMNFFRYPDFPETLNAGTNFSLFVNKAFVMKFNFDIDLLGKNCWSNSNIGVGACVFF